MPDLATTPQPSWTDEELEPGHYFRILRRHRVLLLLGAVVGAAAGLVASSLRPVLFEGVTTILIGRSNSPTASATSRALLENSTLAGQTLKEIGSPLSTQTFVTNNLTVEQVAGTNVMKVKVRLPDAEQAAHASRLLSLKAVDLNRRIASEEGTAVRTQLKGLLDEASDRLKRAELEYVRAQDQAQIELLKKDTEKMVAARGDLVRVRIDIAAEKGRLAAAEQEIQKHDRLLPAPRMVAAESALQHVADKAAAAVAADDVLRQVADQSASLRDAAKPAPADARSDAKSDVKEAKKEPNGDKRLAAEAEAMDATQEALGRLVTGANQPDTQMLDLSHPFVNPVYQTLSFQIATTRTRLAALEREEREIVAKGGGGRSDDLSELYRRTSELARLENNQDLARKIYGELTVRYEQSRSESVDSMVQLQIVDEATTPDRPVSRQRAQSTILGFAAGLVSAAFFALARAGAGAS